MRAGLVGRRSGACHLELKTVPVLDLSQYDLCGTLDPERSRQCLSGDGELRTIEARWSYLRLAVLTGIGKIWCPVFVDRTSDLEEDIAVWSGDNGLDDRARERAVYPTSASAVADAAPG